MSAHSYRDTLKHRGLQPFLWTQFLGAFNDNLFKIVVSMLAVHAAPQRSGRAPAVARRRRLRRCRSCCFPAMPASSPTSYSKRTVLVVDEVARDRRRRPRPVRVRGGTPGAAPTPCCS